jgi:predicted DNA-binding transcriptional regulator YafY
MPAPLDPRRPNRRGVHVTRVLRLLQLLATSPRDVESLARELRCTPRTIWRDLALLEEIHAPIEKRPAGYRLSGPVPFL